MKAVRRIAIASFFVLVLFALSISSSPTRVSAGSTTHDPTWWDKYQFILNNGSDSAPVSTSSVAFGANVDVSNECGPQSETFITINPNNPLVLAGGSNEIFRLPMRGYFSTNGGTSWGGVDLPLPPPKTKSGINFGSDPTLAFDTSGNLFYGYIVVHFGAGNGINGTEMAVARSVDGGRTYPTATFFSFENGANHFNDKPMITADTNSASPFRDSVYIAWDAASGGSSSGGVRLATSRDHGASFTTTRVDDPNGPSKSIGASPAVGPNGEVYVSWNDYMTNAIVFNRSFDGGQTWGVPVIVSTKILPFDLRIPAESFRGALVYPSLDVDRSNGSHRGRIYCSWMDLTAAQVTDIFLSYSDNAGATWSAPTRVGDQLSRAVDRFNHWMSVDPINGDVNVAFYDTRNDTTGFRYQTDYYLAKSTDGGLSFPNADLRVSTVSSNEHDCSGLFPCDGINYGNQQGDYEGLVSFAGVSYPIWTDSRRQLDPASGCRRPFLMEEVFSAKIP
ncbi:MAG TPA: sialidase family protein [Pyrinomonadaceae bacterium]|nr:sialidase family protein [Pyrinomonadaceae bacterium]